jgi:hypothetical protein
MMGDEYLESKGWVLRGSKKYAHGVEVHLYDHPDHQHRFRGFFTKTQATTHQELLDKGYRCSCTPKEFRLYET